MVLKSRLHLTRAPTKYRSQSLGALLQRMVISAKDCGHPWGTVTTSRRRLRNWRASSYPMVHLADYRRFDWEPHDSACESEMLSWKSGALILNLLVRHVEGTAPRLCLWEVGPSRCAALPDLPSSASWTTYRASVVPDAGTKSIRLYLYADGGAGPRTVNEYANAGVVEVPSLPSLALLSNPMLPASPASRLFIDYSSYSEAWTGSEGKHVLVDGMLNGWLVPSRSTGVAVHYAPGKEVQMSQWASLAILLATLLWATRPWVQRMARLRYRGRRIE